MGRAEERHFFGMLGPFSLCLLTWRATVSPFTWAAAASSDLAKLDDSAGSIYRRVSSRKKNLSFMRPAEDRNILGKRQMDRRRVSS
jgi:hypothetical protein